MFSVVLLTKHSFVSETGNNRQRVRVRCRQVVTSPAISHLGLKVPLPSRRNYRTRYSACRVVKSDNETAEMSRTMVADREQFSER